MTDPVTVATSSHHDAFALGFAALKAGDALGAETLFRSVLNRHPHDQEVRYWLAAALIAKKDAQAAEHMLADACTFHAVRCIGAMGFDLSALQNDPSYAAGLAHEFYAAKQPALANAAVGQAMGKGGVTAPLLMLYGMSFQHQGRAEEAVRMFQAATDAFPSAAVHEFLLYALFHTENGCRRYADEARVWARRWAPASPPRRRRCALRKANCEWAMWRRASHDPSSANSPNRFWRRTTLR